MRVDKYVHCQLCYNEVWTHYHWTLNHSLVSILFQSKWINRKRTLVICSRNMGSRERHLVKDLVRMMPHAKTGTDDVAYKERFIMIYWLCVITYPIIHILLLLLYIYS